MAVNQMEDTLVIQSDKSCIEMIVLEIESMILLCIVFIVIQAYDGYNFVVSVVGILWVLFQTGHTFGVWVGINRTLIMTAEGCTVRFYGYEKKYSWNELSVKRYVKGSGKLEEYVKLYGSSYNEGIFFSKHKPMFFKWMSPYNYCVFVRMMSSFFVNFYPLGVSKGHGDHESQMEEYAAAKGKKPFFTPIGVTRKPEVYPVDKTEFLKYMTLWKVEIGGLSEIDKLLYEEEHY